MDTIIKFSNVEFPVSLHKGTVIHANKYSEAYGGTFNLPVSSTLYTDVVFRLSETNEDIKTYIKNLDLPIYHQQEVMVICSGKSVLGYIDMQTNHYYYITKDFCYLLDVGIPVIWVWVAGILGGTILYLIANSEGFLPIFIPFAVAYLFYVIQKRILNYRIQKSVDSFLT